jgi:hypothetical protein
MMDSRLTYPKMPSWNKGFNQALQGTDILVIPPTNSDARFNYEFEFPHNGVLLFGPMSGFLVKGVFESKAPGADDSTFVKLGADSGGNVALIPNWFEHLIKDISVYHGNVPVQTHDVPKHAEPFINTYLYAHMHSDTKDCLFPEPSNPGRCVGVSEKDWSFSDESCTWRKYSEKAFENGKITFRFIPPFLFPFYQDPNFCATRRPPAALPMQIIGKMSVSLMLKEKFDGIFLKPENNLNTYRFTIQSIQLVMEEARLNLSYERKFLNRKEPILYPGMTRIGSFENIASGLLNYRCRFSNVPFPEGIFICALPKESLKPNYKWGGMASKVFKEHRIDSMVFRFNNKALSIRTPNLGEFRHHIMRIRQFLDHHQNPPFGVYQDHGVSTFETTKYGGESTLYPHLYFNLTPSGNESRIIPVGDDGHILSKPGDLDITFNFSTGGATNDAIYLIYIFYTDVSVIFDVKNKQFKTVYRMVGDSSA